jgi:nucleotide-binding universal stress UspA family protein
MFKKILIAIDDSENAKRAAAFVAQTFTSDSRITLFSVVPDTASICEMDSPELTPYFVTQQSSFCTIEAKKRELIENALAGAKEDLLAAGFSADAITVKMEAKKKGIARDIADEAQTGYDVVVLGRRGVSGIKEFFLGSISQKVINAVKDVSVLFVN